MKSPTCAALALFLTLPLVACDHDHGDHDHEEVDQVAEGCKHLEFGPEVALEIDPNDPPTVETFHTRYDMTLLGTSAAGNNGLLDYTSPGGMHYLIFDQSFEFAIADAEGAPVEPSMVEENPASCEAAGAVHHVMLPAGTYTLYFDAVPSALLQMVIHVENQSHDHAH